MGALISASRPATAYELVRLLMEDRHFIAPQQVYRTLERLVADRRIARIETLHAYCRWQRGDGDGPLVFCRNCRTSTRTPGPDLEEQVLVRGAAAGFRADRVVIEIAGTCPACQASVTTGKTSSHVA